MHYGSISNECWYERVNEWTNRAGEGGNERIWVRVYVCIFESFFFYIALREKASPTVALFICIKATFLTHDTTEYSSESTSTNKMDSVFRAVSKLITYFGPKLYSLRDN